jgi:NodT family efflux transporter outer membrane factor (OMF) lipoprotein
MKPLLPATVASLALGLAGCQTFRTPYVRPAAAVPAQWAHGQDAAAGAPGDFWWRRFGDARLDRLIDRVLERDNDLAAAGIALGRAQLQARYAAINPTFNAGAGYGGSAPLSAPFPTSRTATATLSASYELDLFGKLAAQRDVAVWEARATEQDVQSTRLALIGTAVDLYYQIAYLNERVALSEQSIAYAQKTLDLVQVRRRAGGVSSLEVALSTQSLASQHASLRDLLQQRVAAQAALNLLLNGQTVSAQEELQLLPGGPLPTVDADLPASLLGRRPDLRAAELRLREQLASLDQTRLSFYPSLSLTGSVGGASTSLADVLNNPFGSLGSNLALPFLNIEQVKLSVGVSRANYEADVVHFRQTLLQALSDVDNALSAREQYALQAADLAESLTDARTVERLDEILYRAGSIPLKTWLDAQETRRQAEAAAAANRLNQFQTYVAIYKALGGDAALTPLAGKTDQPGI